MTNKAEDFDVVIIGAGFFGAVLADYLSTIPTIKSIAVIEKENIPLSRASANNQARIHQGFHYPRSIKTAASSRRTYEKFKSRWPRAVFSDFDHIYAISKFGSKISSLQFEATMNAVRAPFTQADPDVTFRLFDLSRIEKAYQVKEEVFNYLELRTWAQETLNHAKVTTFFETKALLVKNHKQSTQVELDSGLSLSTRYLFNVTYSGIDKIEGLAEETGANVFHQITEMPLVEVPEELRRFGVTVMDGPFFSLMPYPSIPNASTFSHVRYTQRRSNISSAESHNLDKDLLSLRSSEDSHFEYMKRDAARYIPSIKNLKQVGQIFETKTLLSSSVREDSRPILFIKHRLANAYSILGGKIDNVFDMIERLKQERIQ